MNPFPSFRILLAGIALGMQAAELAPAFAQAPAASGQRMSRVAAGVVGETLHAPLFQTRQPGEFSVSLDPHPGDLVSRDFIRLPLRVEYGLTRHVELRSGLHPYVDNPFRSHGSSGLTHFSLGFKNRWLNWGPQYLETATGIDFEQPVGERQLGLHDGKRHFAPFITMSYQLPRFAQVFAALRVDLSPDAHRRPPVPGEPPPLHDFYRLTLGTLQQGTRFATYTFETIWEQNMDRDASRKNLYLAPGLIWDIPRRRAGGVYLPGRWQLGLALRVGFFDARGAVRLQTRVRWNRI